MSSDLAGALVLPRRVALTIAAPLVAAAIWSAAEMHFANRAQDREITSLSERLTAQSARIDEISRERQVLATDVARLQVELRTISELVREVRDLVRDRPRP